MPKPVISVLYDPRSVVPFYARDTKILTIGDISARSIIKLLDRYYPEKELLEKSPADMDVHVCRFVNLYAAYQLKDELVCLEENNPWFWDDYADKILYDVSSSPLMLKEVDPVDFIEREYPTMRTQHLLAPSSGDITATQPVKWVEYMNSRVHHQSKEANLAAFSRYAFGSTDYDEAYLSMLIGTYTGSLFSPHTEFVHPSVKINILRGYNILMSLSENGHSRISPDKPAPRLGEFNRIIFNPEMKPFMDQKLGIIVLDTDDPDVVLKTLNGRISSKSCIDVYSASTKRHRWQVNMVRAVIGGALVINHSSYDTIPAEEMPVMQEKKKTLDKQKGNYKEVSYKGRGIRGVSSPHIDKEGHLVYDSAAPWQLLDYDLSGLNVDVVLKIQDLRKRFKDNGIIMRYILLGRIEMASIFNGSAYPEPQNEDEVRNILSFAEPKIIYL